MTIHYNNYYNQCSETEFIELIRVLPITESKLFKKWSSDSGSESSSVGAEGTSSPSLGNTGTVTLLVKSL
jgi:hypothetical protein